MRLVKLTPHRASTVPSGFMIPRCVSWLLSDRKYQAGLAEFTRQRLPV
jgi:hypothetical protein